MTRRHAARAALLAAGFACNISEPQRFMPPRDASVGDCPQLFAERTEVWVDTTCKLSRCGPNTVEQQGCTLRLNAEGCDVGELLGEVDAGGFVRFTPVTSVGDCVSRDPVEGAAMALFCATGAVNCRLDVYHATSTASFSAMKLKLLDVEPPPLNQPQFYIESARTGYLAGAVALDRLLVIVSRNGRYEYPPSCSGAEQTSVIFVDPASASIVGTATTPPCLVHLAPDPAGDGFLGAFAMGPPQVGRFDRRGRLLEAIAIEIPELPVPDAYVTDMTVAPNTNAVQINFMAPQPEGTGGHLVVSDLRPFGNLRWSKPPARPAIMTTIAALADGTVLSGNIRGDHIEIFDAITAAHLSEITLAADRMLNIGPGPMSVRYPQGRVTIGGLAKDSAAVVFSKTRVFGAAIPFELPAHPLGSAPIPGREDLIAVGLTQKAAPNTAYVALLLADPPRFLVGATPIGIGAVGAILDDGLGGLWAVLPTEGSIVRVELGR